MATDPLQSLNPLANVRTQPTATEMQTASPERDVLAEGPQPLTPDQRIDRALDNMDRRRKNEEAARLQGTPQQQSRYNSAARELGVDPSQITDLEMAERMVQVRRQMQMRERYPAISKLFDEHPDVASISLGDDENIGSMAALLDLRYLFAERLFDTGGRQMGDMFRAEVVSAEEGVLGAVDALEYVQSQLGAGIDYRANSEARADYIQAGRDRLQNFRDQTQASRERYGSDNFWIEGILTGAESVPLTMAAMLTRNPNAGAGLIGGMVGADAFQTGRMQGLDAPTSIRYALTQGGAEFVFERIPIGFLMNMGGKNFAGALGGYMMRELPSELATTLVQSFSDWSELPESRGRSFTDWYQGLPTELVQTGLAVAGGGSVTVTTLKGLETAGNVLRRRDMRRQMAKFGQMEGDYLTQLGAAAERSALREADPEAFATLMRGLADDAGVSTILVPGSALTQYFQSESYDRTNDPLSPYEEKALEADAAGNDVAIPTETVFSNVVGTKAWNVLKDDMRITAGGMTKRQADAYIEAAAEQETFDGLQKEVTAADTQASAREAQVQRVQEKLEKDGGLAPFEAKQYAFVLTARMAARASLMGQDDAQVEQAIEALDVRMTMPPELERAVRAEEKDMVVSVLRGNTKGSTNRARGAAKELERVLKLRGFKPSDLSDDQLDEVIEGLRPAGETDGREYRHGRDAGRGGRELTGDGAAGARDGETQALEGAPTVTDATGPDPNLVAVAEQYAAANGIEYAPQAVYVRVNPEFAAQIAAAYEEMEHAPDDPAVAAAYADMIQQARAQYDALIEAGYEFSFYDENSDPYDGNPWNAMRDLRAGKSMAVFSTKPLSETEGQSYGSSATDLDVSDNPMLAETGLTWKDQDGNEHPVLANDLFRAVHDAFGHGLEGAGFRARGEENAWQAHALLFTGPALQALTSETRGQNLWLNFGPYGEQNRKAKVEDTVFADQKTGLLPSWAWEDGRSPVEGTIVVDQDGNPTHVFHGTGHTFERFKDTGKAVWFSEGEKLAENYGKARARQRGVPPTVIQATVAAQNPLTIDLADENPARTVEDARAWAMEKFGFDLEKHGWERSKGTEYISTITRSNAFANAAREAGFDALKMQEAGKMTWGLLKRGSVVSADSRVLYQSADNDNTISLDEYRRQRELEGFRRNFLGEMSEEMRLRSEVINLLREQGLLPFEVGTRFTTAKSRELGQGPWEVIGYYVNQDGDKFGYYVRRGESGVDFEKTLMLVSDPDADARIRKTSPDWDRDANTEQWRVLTGPTRQYEQANVFYSALERAAEAIQTERAPAQQWIATLKKTPGVKQEELEWTGVIDWLELQEGPVEKAQVVEVIQKGGIEVREVVLAKATEDSLDPVIVDDLVWEQDDVFYDSWEPTTRTEEIEEAVEGGEVETKWIVVDLSGDPVSDEVYDSEDDAQDAALEADQEASDEAYLDWESERRSEVIADMLENDRATGTQWQDFSLSRDGDESYRELLITLPPHERNNPRQQGPTHFDGSYGEDYSGEGVVAHARFFDAKGPDGERILFLDEIQSDWHQSGREEGYNTEPLQSDMDEAFQLFEDARNELTKARAILEGLVGGPVPDGAELAGDVMQEPGVAEAWTRLSKAQREYSDAKEYRNAVEGGASPDAIRKARNNMQAAVDEARKAREIAAPARDALHDALKPMSALVEQSLSNLDRNDLADLIERKSHKAALDRPRGGLTMEDLSYFYSDFRGALATIREDSPELHAEAVSAFAVATEAMVEMSEFNKALQESLTTKRLRESELGIALLGGSIPDAPFKKSWPTLVMKRITSWAAEGGYDQVAWIKQGENNGGMNDNVEWFYGKELPNMTGKFLKPYKAKVKPLRVKGHTEVPIGRLKEIEDRLGEIGSVQGMVREGFSISNEYSEDLTRSEMEDKWKAARAKLEEARQSNLDEVERQRVELLAQQEMRDEAFEGESSPSLEREMRFTEGKMVTFQGYADGYEQQLKASEDFDGLWERAWEAILLLREQAELKKTAPTNLGFDITPELREAAAGGFPLFQRDHKDAGPRGRILLPGNTDQGAVIELFQGRDLSTLIHESSHLWLEELKADASNPNAPEQLVRDYKTVLKWFKDNGHEVRDGVIPVGAHEMWARTGERYVREGKAPSTFLKRAFESFRQWLTARYENVRELRAPITPEIREVFDRLLATEAEIAEAREVQGVEALLDSAIEVGMSPDEFANYQEQVASARAEAHGRVLEKAMEDIKRRESRLGRERRRRLKDQMATAIEDMPLFKAFALLREERMDKQLLIDRFGEEIVGQLPARVPPVFANEGTDPEEIAERSGFNTAQDMIETMIAANAEQKAAKEGGDKRAMKTRMIDQMADQAMAAQFGGPMTDQEIKDEALDAVANERQGEVIASEINAVSRMIGKKATAYQTARDWARTRVRQGTYVEEASKQALQRHRRAIAAAGKEAEQALLDQDMEAVYRAKQKQMLSSALLMEAKQANEEVETARARMERVAKARTMKSVDQDYLEQAHALLESVDLKPRSQTFLDRKGSWEEWATARQAEGYDIVTPEGFEALIGTTNWSRLPVDQLLGLDAAIKQVIHIGRHKQTLLDNQKRRDLEEILREVDASADRIGRKPPKGSFLDKGFWDNLKQRVAAFDAGLLKIEQVVDWLDSGNPNGVFNRMIFRPIAQAQNRARVMMEEYHSRLKEAADKVGSKQLRAWADRVTLDLIDPEDGRPAVMERKKLIAMALNWGNEGNRQRLTDGYGWSEQGIQRALDEHLTEEDWQYVRDVWDALESLWPETAALERRVNGVEPEKIEVMDVSTPFGTFRGGYYPAVYDSRLDYKTEGREAAASDRFEANYIRATTRASSTKSRSEKVTRPILLDLGVINRHVGEVVHDITHREAVMGISQFIGNERVKRAIDETLGREIRQQFDPWLNYVANSWAAERAGNEGIGAFMGKLRANVTVVGMGWRFTTIMTQIAGYSNSFEFVGERWVIPMMAKFSAQLVGSSAKFATFQGVEMPEMMAFALERSEELKFRLDTLDRDIRLEMDRVSGLGPKTGALRGGLEAATSVRTFAFHGIGYMDRMVSVPTWMGAYNKAVSQGMSDEDAVFYADKAIRLSQGAGSPKDLAAVSRGTGRWGEAFKLMTMFYTYLSTVYSRQRNLGRDAVRARSAGEFGSVLARAWWLIVVPPLLAEFLSGRGPDEDEEYWMFAFQKILSQSLGAIPVVRDVNDPVFDALQGQRAFDYRLSPLQGAGQSYVNVAGDVGRVFQGKPTKRATRNAIEAVGYTTGLAPGQMASSTQFLVDISYGEADPETAAEWYEGLTKGRIKDD